jgi:hypothetical protein
MCGDKTIVSYPDQALRVELMCSQCSAIVILMMSFLFALSPSGPQEHKARTKHDATPVARAIQSQAIAPSSLSPSSPSQFLPWGRQVRSVHGKTHLRIAEELDLGPAYFISRFIRFLESESSLRRPLTVLQLRC